MLDAQDVNIAVIGAGAWGTTLAKVLAENWPEKKIALWVRRPELTKLIESARENQTYLPGIKLPNNIWATNSIGEALRLKNFIVFAVPSQYMAEALYHATWFMEGDYLIINTAKGIEWQAQQEQYRFMHQLFHEHGRQGGKSYSVLSGPSFAREVADGKPTRVVAAAWNYETGRVVQRVFSNEYLAVETSSDVPGVELCAALKNVVAIGVGLADGLEFGDNVKAVITMKGMQEIARLGVAMRIDPDTLQGPAGLGDLILTCMGKLSRNREVGRRIARGEKLIEVLATLGGVAEGVHAVRGAVELARRYGLEMSVVKTVYRVLYADESPRKAMRNLVLL